MKERGARGDRERETGVGERREGIGAEKGRKKSGGDRGWLGVGVQGGWPAVHRNHGETPRGREKEEGAGNLKKRGGGPGLAQRKEKERKPGRFSGVRPPTRSKHSVLLKTRPKRRRFVK